MKKTSKTILSIILLAILVAIDQITKHLSVVYLAGNDPVDIIKNVLQLTYVRNDGAAWGIFAGKQWFFIMITILMLALLTYVLFRTPAERKYNFFRIIIVTLMAGAIGNFIDRIANGYVHDFIYFKVIDFPVFNFADICVTLSMVALIFVILFGFKDNDFNFLKKQKVAEPIDDPKEDENDE